MWFGSMTTNKQVDEMKSRLDSAKDAAVASKARNDRNVVQLGNNKEGSAATIKALRTSEAELKEALGLVHMVEDRLCSMGVKLRGLIATLTNDKEQNLISWTLEEGGVGRSQGGAGSGPDRVSETAVQRQSPRRWATQPEAGAATTGEPDSRQTTVGHGHTIRGWCISGVAQRCPLW